MYFNTYSIYVILCGVTADPIYSGVFEPPNPTLNTTAVMFVYRHSFIQKL